VTFARGCTGFGVLDIGIGVVVSGGRVSTGTYGAHGFVVDVLTASLIILGFLQITDELRKNRQ